MKCGGQQTRLHGKEWMIIDVRLEDLFFWVDSNLPSSWSRFLVRFRQEV